VSLFSLTDYTDVHRFFEAANVRQEKFMEGFDIKENPDIKNCRD